MLFDIYDRLTITRETRLVCKTERRNGKRNGAEEEEEQIVNVRTLVCGNGQS